VLHTPFEIHWSRQAPFGLAQENPKRFQGQTYRTTPTSSKKFFYHKTAVGYSVLLYLFNSYFVDVKHDQ
jgi:hypothetical protein